MDNTKLRELIEQTLAKDDRLFYAEESAKPGTPLTLDAHKLLHLLDGYDPKVIDLLFSVKQIRDRFFQPSQSAYIFKLNEFRFFIEENKIDNSYTQYRNRIGLTDGKRFIKDSSDIVINFPYKDCVLEGGQSTEEGQDVSYKLNPKTGGYDKSKPKRKEIFYNEILAPDEIDRLLDEKAFVNWKRYSKKGAGPVRDLARDKRGLLKENLIIKGNNLLALHSLRRKYAGKIKLIYADPPYNTKGARGTFTYNNTFNHSTWLTFMKNRLEVAKELLREDGIIAVAIDHCELLYLGVLMDEIFNSDNRLGIITVLSNPRGRQFVEFFAPSTDYMLVYAKNRDLAAFNKVAIDENKKKTFNMKDEKGLYRLSSFMRTANIEDKLKNEKDKYHYPIYVSQDLQKITLEEKKGYIRVLPQINSKDYCWGVQAKTFIENLDGGEEEYVAIRSEDGNVEILKKYREQQMFLTHWIDKKYNATFHGTRLLEKLLGRKSVSYPKSLYLMEDLLKIITSKEDIILDFFAGSGTTGHATLRLNKEDGGNRIFILIEQLQEHIEVLEERHKKVIKEAAAEATFVYTELAEWNERAKGLIKSCKSLSELEKLFGGLADKYFLNYNVQVKNFQDKIIKEKEFRNLTLEQQKVMFIEMLDLNQLYVNRSEMEDSKYKIGKGDIKLTNSFYQS